MTLRRHLKVRLLHIAMLCGALLLASRPASAYPMLQVDIGGGTYNSTMEEIVAGVNSSPLTPGKFMLYVYLYNPSAAQLAQTYFISAALTPQVFPPGGNFGNFTFGSPTTPFSYEDTNPANAIPDGTIVNVPALGTTKVFATRDMVYGNPPLESFAGCSPDPSNNCHDPGDLAPHGIYNTYFKEFAFKFNSPVQRTNVYNTADTSGQTPTPVAGGAMYYEAFTVDTSFLSGYQVHFDLYSEVVKGGGDLDISQFAPFSHTARSSAAFTPLPEPGTLALLGGGGVVALFAKYRRRRPRTNP